MFYLLIVYLVSSLFLSKPILSSTSPDNHITKAVAAAEDEDSEYAGDITNFVDNVSTVNRNTLAASQTSPIYIENQKPGTTAWKLTSNSYKVASDASKEIKGYADKTSVNKGETINFKVTVNPVQTYTLDIYRIGWYQGKGGRFMQSIGPLNGIKQHSCPTDTDTGLSECAWTTSYSLTVPTDWTSGAYLVVARNANKYSNYINFTVRDDLNHSDILLQNSTNTWEAYNGYPEGSGKSLYSGKSWGAKTIASANQAVKVSYDRPYMNTGTRLDSWEIQFIQWAEAQGYDITYSTDVDTHSNGSMLLNHKAFLAVGHDEYWTKQARDNIQKAINSGVNVAFFGGNDMFWQVRYETSKAGVAYRVIVGYKEAYKLDPYYKSSDQAKNKQTTTQFRLPPVSNTEQKIIGTMYSKNLGTHDKNLPMTILASSHWAFVGTGLKNGDTIPNVYGYEYNKVNSSYSKPANTTNFTILAKGTDPAGGIANTTIYTAQSGALVFSAGSTDWSWTLNAYHTSGLNYLSPAIQKITSNVLDKFITFPAR